MASETHRTKSFVREAILRSLDEMEDFYLADQVMERIRKGEEKTYSLDEVEARLGLGAEGCRRRPRNSCRSWISRSPSGSRFLP